jgi:hypothetical protein
VSARAVLFLFNVIETNVLRESSRSEFSHSLDPKQTSGHNAIGKCEPRRWHMESRRRRADQPAAGDAAFNAAEATFDTPSGARSATRVAHQKFGTTALAGTATPIFGVTLTADIAVCLSENVAAMGAASLMLTHRGHKWLRANRANFSDRFRPWLGRIATFASIILVHNQLACGPANRRTRKTSPAGAGSVVFKQTQAN